MLYPTEWLLMGALGTIFIFFTIFYLTKRDEKYNLVFALGCLITIVRTVSYTYVDVLNQDTLLYVLNVKLDHLTFIWGPFLYAMLAESIFPEVAVKYVKQVFWSVAAIISGLILIVPMTTFPYARAYDPIIVIFSVYAVYVYTAALYKKRPYAIPVFAANTIFISGMAHDVLRGSGIIRGAIGELFGYAYLLFAFVIAAVLAQRYMRSEKKQAEMQLKFLHAQIQPHFLYNTLGTISAYCRTDPKQAGELLQYLSTYLRAKFRDEGEQFSCLHDELALIKAYLTIEQARFHDRLTVTYDIEEDISVLMPSLLLQPLVENAVKHGLLARKEGGEIAISVHRLGENVVIKIKDNGVGMEPSELAEVLEGRRGGIGIRNTNARLQKYYNTGIQAESKRGAGTEMTVIIPLNGRRQALCDAS